MSESINTLGRVNKEYGKVEQNRIDVTLEVSQQRNVCPNISPTNYNNISLKSTVKFD